MMSTRNSDIRNHRFKAPIVTLLVAVALSSVILWRGAALALDPKKAITQYSHDVWQTEDGLPHNSALSFPAPEKIKFKYRLEGFDEDWVDADSRRVAYYTHIPPRNYRFQVRACNSDGLWNETGAAFEFSIQPPFYHTGAFYVLCIVSVVLMGIGVHRLRVRQMKAREKGLVSLVADRTAELQQQIKERQRAEEALRRAHDELEVRVRERTFELATINQALQAEITERKQAEEEIGHRLVLEEALAQISSLFASAVDPDLNHILKLLGQVVGANRAYIFRLRDNGYMMDNTHEWCDMKTKPQIQELQGLEIARTPWWMNQLERGENIAISDVDALPEEAKVEKEILQGQQIHSLLAVPITSKDGALLGFMGFDDTEKCRTWSDEDSRVLRVVSEMISNYFARQQAEETLRASEARYRLLFERNLASLREKEVLLKEIHHRVKNNLQLISSLLNLQADYTTDRQTLEMFRECQNRVKSMALIHEKLYQAKDLARIDCAEYIRNLAAHLFGSYSINANTVRLRVSVADVALGLDAAIPCGLIINELVTNSLKYAFPAGQAGEIRIQLQAERDHQLTLTVSDNGVGLPTEVDFPNTETLGLHLISLLTRQLGGTIELERRGGTRFKIMFRELT